MSPNLRALMDSPVIMLDSIDSTNNYAMRLADADKAQPGLTIVSASQTQGKGQRGRRWHDTGGESLLMSIILMPGRSLDEQFIFNASVTIAIADVLQTLYEHWDVRIKWPNDLIINDKKTGGILIENVLRGNEWVCSIVGIGINVLQKDFPAELPHATSLLLASEKTFDINELIPLIRKGIFTKLLKNESASAIMGEYNDHLYRREMTQYFTDGVMEWNAVIKSTGSNGKLQVQLADGSILHYNHGDVQWKWR